MGRGEISKASSRTSSWKSFPSPLPSSSPRLGQIATKEINWILIRRYPPPPLAGWIHKRSCKKLGRRRGAIIRRAWLLRIIFIRSWKKKFQGEGTVARGKGHWWGEGRGESKGKWKGVWHDYALAILNRARTREVGRIKIMNPLARNG